jgi:hypothetical protein
VVAIRRSWTDASWSEWMLLLNDVAAAGCNNPLVNKKLKYDER